MPHFMTDYYHMLQNFDILQARQLMYGAVINVQLRTEN